MYIEIHITEWCMADMRGVGFASRSIVGNDGFAAQLWTRGIIPKCTNCLAHQMK
jgi:hypothetical protein